MRRHVSGLVAAIGVVALASVLPQSSALREAFFAELAQDGLDDLAGDHVHLSERMPPPDIAEVVGGAVHARGGLPEVIIRHLLGYVPLPSLVASSSGRSRAALWHTRSDQPLFVFPGRQGHIVDMKLFPRGDRLVTAGSDGSVVIWCANLGSVLHVLRGHVGEVYEVQVFPEGDRVVAVGQDSAAVVWDVASGAGLQRLDQGGNGAPHHVVRVFLGGDKLVTGVSYRGHSGAIVWNASSGQALHRLRQPEGWTRFIELSPDGETFATVGSRSVFIWSSTSGLVMRELSGAHGGLGLWINGVAFAAGGAKVVTSSPDAFAVLWDLHTGARRHLEMQARILGVVGMPMSDRVVVFNESRAVVWNTTSGSILRSLAGAGEIQRVAVSSTGDVVAACTSSLNVPHELQGTTVWDAASGRILQQLPEVDSDLWPFAGEPRLCSVALGGMDPGLAAGEGYGLA